MYSGEWLLALLAKGTIAVFAASIASLLLRHRSAALRHSLWTATAATLLALPFLSGLRLLPTIPISLPIAAASTASPASPTDQPHSATDLAKPSARATQKNYPREMLLNIGWERALAVLWSSVALMLVVWVLLGHVMVARLVAASPQIADEAWIFLVTAVRRELGVSERIDLRWSDDATGPTAYGLLKPGLLIPRRAIHWTAEERRLVLTHEIAHVRRRDCITQLVAELTCAMWWLHPGAWYVARRARLEREEACDDAVIECGGEALSYARFLLECAVGKRRSSLALATIPFTRPSQLEGRIMGVLNVDKSRQPGSRLQFMTMATLAMLVAVVSGEVRPVSAASPAHSRNAQTAPRTVAAAQRGMKALPSRAQNEKRRRGSTENQANRLVVANNGAATLTIEGDKLVYAFAPEDVARPHDRDAGSDGAWGGAAAGVSGMHMEFPLAEIRLAAAVRGGVVVDMKSRPSSEPESSDRGRVFFPGVKDAEARALARAIASAARSPSSR